MGNPIGQQHHNIADQSARHQLFQHFLIFFILDVDFHRPPGYLHIIEISAHAICAK